MTVQQIYDKLCERIPEYLREPWDNDGLMCASDSSMEVKRALLTLDVTENIVDYAISSGIDLIVSHHPLIFKPLGSLTENSHVSRKVIKLIKNDIAVISLHTRADKVEGGVNDQLAEILGLRDVVPFGEGGLGRIGTLDEELGMEDFSYLLKGLLNCDGVKVSDACIPVQRVAVVGGDGKSYIPDALALGADTFVSGRISYNTMEEAAELGINLLEAGHYFTENPVVERFSQMLSRIDSSLVVQTLESNVIKAI